MGSGASHQNTLNLNDTIATNSTDEEYLKTYIPPEFALDDLTWIKIFYTYETKDSFSTNTFSIKFDATASLLSQPEEILSINGFSWKYFTQDDDEENIHSVEYFDPYKKQFILNKCQQAYLYNKYHENFSKPPELSSDSVFTCLSFLVRTPDNKTASTELSGCIPYGEHLLALGKQSTASLTQKDDISEDMEGGGDLRKGNWSSRLKDLLPGDKFEESRADIRQLLVKVEALLDESLKGINLFHYKCHIYLYYKRQCQAYHHLIQEGITTDKGEKHMKEFEHWKEQVNDEIQKMLTDLLDPVFIKVESLLTTVIPSTSSSFSNLIPSFHKLKSSLQTTFIAEIYKLAELLDQQETTAFDQLHIRFNQNPTTPPPTSSQINGIANSPSNKSQSSTKNSDGGEPPRSPLLFPSSESKPPNGNSRRRSKASPGGGGSGNGGTPTSKQGDRRPLSAALDLSRNETPIAEVKESPRSGRRKTIDPSQKYGPIGTLSTPTNSTHITTNFSENLTSSSDPLLNSVLINGNGNGNGSGGYLKLNNSTNGGNGNISVSSTTPPSPTSSTAASTLAASTNPLHIIKHASYQISKQKLIKKFELRKFNQKAMSSYMLKEYNLLENKLLSQYNKELEELNILQAKELATFLNSQQQQQQQQQQRQRQEQQRQEQQQPEEKKEGKEEGKEKKEGEEDREELNQQNENTQENQIHEKSENINKEINNENDLNNGGEDTKEDLTRQSRSLLRQYTTDVPSSSNTASSSAMKSHQFHIPLDLSVVEDVAAIRKTHEEIKIKLENYLLEKRRIKRKTFDDAKNITFEKLAMKLQDIKTESGQAMLSPAGMGKYKTILKIINLMKNNGK